MICPCCRGDLFLPLVDCGTVPQSGVYLKDRDAPCSMVTLAFDYCARCALIHRRPLGEVTADYQHVNRTTGHQLPVYTDQILKALHNTGVATGDLVVEVGANDGTFLSVLEQEGFGRRLGVEPSIECAAQCQARGHAVEAIHLTAASAGKLREQHGAARLVVCRHTLEHVPEPQEFLQAIRHLLQPDGWVFIEVPSALGIVRELRGHQLWDEHVNTFSPNNLPLAMQQAGFEVVSVDVALHLDLWSILLWARLAQSPQLRFESTQNSRFDVESCQLFLRRWEALISRLRRDLAETPKPVAGIGAAHPQSNLWLLTGLRRPVDWLVDDAPSKIGRYLPIPEPVPIVSSAQLLNALPVGTIVRTGFGYDDWMKRLCVPLAERGVRVIDPFREVNVFKNLGS